ncbi:MAG TPA: hypothetical protein VFZ95_02730, partial [Steroidobacteraceae bacterium]
MGRYWPPDGGGLLGCVPSGLSAGGFSAGVLGVPGVVVASPALPPGVVAVSPAAEGAVSLPGLESPPWLGVLSLLPQAANSRAPATAGIQIL